MADVCMPITVAVLTIWSSLPVIAVPTLTIQPATPNTGSTLTLTCELATGFTTALMDVNKDGTTVYTCASGGQTCDALGGSSDYSEVDWSQTNKGIVTISNAAQSRDGGDWTCAVGGGGGTSLAVMLTITGPDCGNPTKPTNGQVSFTTTTYQSTATYSCDSGNTIDETATTTCQADGTWSGSVPTCTCTTTTSATKTTTTTTATQAPTTTTTTKAPTTTMTTQAPTATTTTTTISTTRTTSTSTTSTTTGSTGSTGARERSDSQTTAMIIALLTVFGSIIVMAAAAFGVILFRKHYTSKKPNSTVKVKLHHSNRPDGQGRGQSQGD